LLRDGLLGYQTLALTSAIQLAITVRSASCTNARRIRD